MDLAPTIPAPMPATPPRGWVLYDGICPICLAGVRRWAPMLTRRGFGFAPLQTDWVRARLGLLPGELPPEIKLLRPNGSMLGGIDACAEIGRTVWWLWPFAVLAGWPGFHALAGSVYRWIATNRYCLGDVCPLPHHAPPRRHHAVTTFLELP